MTGQRRRRWLFLAAMTIAALAALTAIGIALYGADPVRVVALLQEALRRDLGLSLTYDGQPRLTWWPHAGVALDSYRIDVVATSKPLAWGDALAIEVPWRALRSDRVEIERIALDGPVFHAAALEGWPIGSGTEGGPSRWPAVESGIVVTNATYIGPGVPPRVVEGIDLEVSRIGIGRKTTMHAAWHGAPAERGDGPRVRVMLDATPVDAAEGLGLDAMTLEVAARNAAPFHFEGRARSSGSGRGSIAGKLQSASLAPAIAAYLAPHGPQAATSLEIALEKTRRDWHVVANGSLAGSKVDANLRLTEAPDFTQPFTTWIASLERGMRGHFGIAQLRVGDVVLEGVEITNGEPRDRATAARPTKVTAPGATRDAR